jgi:hypothetical protein
VAHASGQSLPITRLTWFSTLRLNAAVTLVGSAYAFDQPRDVLARIDADQEAAARRDAKCVRMRARNARLVGRKLPIDDPG